MLGGDYIRNKLRDVFLSQFGSYRMANGPPRPGEVPVQYTQTFGVADLRYGQTVESVFAQDDIRISPRITENLGLRYDLDTNLRMNDYFKDLLANPFWAGLDKFTPADNRGNDYNNLQPRLGITYDVKGNGSFVLRGASGVYVTRNRPYFEMTTMDRTSGTAVRIEDPNLLKNYPSIEGVLGGQSLESYLAKGGAKSVFMIGGDNVLPWAINSTGGFGMQLNRVTSLDVVYVF